MKKINLLILGYSGLVQRRLLKSIKKIKEINYKICSKSFKSKNVSFNNYIIALKSKPDLVYISLTNHLHYKYAKIALKLGLHVIVDKPISTNIKKTLELVRIAKNKKILISESTMFSYHEVFDKILKIIGGKNKIEFIQSNFNVPQTKSLRIISNTQSDCFDDMSPYAAAIIRLFLDSKIKKINFHQDKFSNKKNIKNFYIFIDNEKIKYFGNFGIDKEYLSQIIFVSKKKIIYLNHQAFALPSNKKIVLKIKENNTYKKVLIKKDDCIKNYMKQILKSVKLKRYNKFYSYVINDANIRNKIKKK